MQRDDGRPFQRDRIRRDRNYAIELKYACAHGIPWSRYLRMFDRVDRARVIANELEEGSRCSMCGTAQWEWDEDPGAYEAVPHMEQRLPSSSSLAITRALSTRSNMRR